MQVSIQVYWSPIQNICLLYAESDLTMITNSFGSSASELQEAVEDSSPLSECLLRIAVLPPMCLASRLLHSVVPHPYILLG
jgi:hypothetical protein